jgi:hypothetical protein
MMTVSTAVQCARCLNDATVPDVTFDAGGLCSFCVGHDQWRARLEDRDRLSRIWRDKLARYRGQGPFDALCGLSGGKDSTYVLYELVRRYGLTVKVVTVENGFMTDWARAGIERTVADLGVAHEYVAWPRPQLAALYLSSLRATGGICTACAYSTFATLLSLAGAAGIPMVVHGRSPAQMVRFLGEGSRDPFIPFLRAALQEADAVDVAATYAGVRAAMARNIPPAQWPHLARLLPDDRGGRAPDFVPFFLYHAYAPGPMVASLERTTSWRRPARFSPLAHYDCRACSASSYLSQLAEGRPHLLPDVSAAIRLGEMTREDGRRRLDEERFTAAPAESLAELAAFVERPPAELMAMARAAGRRRPPSPA